MNWRALIAAATLAVCPALAAKPATQADFGKQFGMVTANCKSCHEGFRIKKS